MTKLGVKLEDKEKELREKLKDLLCFKCGYLYHDKAKRYQLSKEPSRPITQSCLVKLVIDLHVAEKTPCKECKRQSTKRDYYIIFAIIVIVSIIVDLLR